MALKYTEMRFEVPGELQRHHAPLRTSQPALSHCTPQFPSLPACSLRSVRTLRR